MVEDRCIKHREKNYIDGECPICKLERQLKTPKEIIKELLKWLSEEHIGLDETFLEQFPYVKEWIEGEK